MTPPLSLERPAFGKQKGGRGGAEIFTGTECLTLPGHSDVRSVLRTVHLLPPTFLFSEIGFTARFPDYACTRRSLILIHYCYCVNNLFPRPAQAHFLVPSGPPCGRMPGRHAPAADPERRVVLLDGHWGFAGWADESHGRG